MTDHGARSDAVLLAAHVDGDGEAFAELLARHRDRLWAVALRTVGNPHDAEDALQEAVIRAFRSAGSFRGDAAVTTWLHRVVVNACLDHLRRMKVRRAESLDERIAGNADDEGAAGREQLVQRTLEPHAAAERAERVAAVRAALAELPEDQRAALVLVDLNGFSVEESAAVLEVAPGTVKSRCSRGRRRLAGLLAAWEPEVAGEPRADPVRPIHDPSATTEPPRR